MDLDLLISDSRVVDGTGAPWFRADVGVKDGHVAAVGRLSEAHAARRIDAAGRVVSPGWIDIHTHSDFGVIADPPAECAVRQGSTTHVIGNCGVSAAPIADETRELAARQLGTYGHVLPDEWSDYAGYLEAVERRGVGTNIAPLVGHGTVRLAVLGTQERPPTPEELNRMRAHVDEAMRAGCFGMSTGLVYPPGCFGGTDEVVALAEVVARYGGMYASHIRGERETIVEAVTECIAIGERSGCRVQISHNCPKFGGWHLQDQVIALWEEARARGLEVTVDNDLHTDFGPSLGEALPQWTFQLSTAELMDLLNDPARRAALKDEIKRDARPAFGPAGLLVHEAFERIFVLRSPTHPDRDGKTIEAIAEATGADPWDAFFDQIVADRNATMAVFDYMSLEHIERMLRHPLVMVSSDGWVIPPDARLGTPDGDPAPYMPCSYAEYPGLIQRYVVERPVLTLEEAVRKSTSMPAAKIGLHDRGVIRPGMSADLLVFDPEHVRDRATDLWPHDSGFPTYPHEHPEGIDWVLVNGQVAVEEGGFLGTLAGRVLRSGT